MNLNQDFDETDFYMSVSQLQRFINKTGLIEFEGISILTTECNYGGKIDSAWEGEKMRTILRKYFNESIVTDINYEFYPTDGQIYGIPRKFEYRDMILHIEKQIPSGPSPFVYDMHPNSRIRSDTQRGKILVDDLVLTLGRVEDPVTDEKEENLNIFLGQLKGLLETPIDLIEVKAKFPNDFRESLNMNLLQESISYNLLIERVTKTLNQLQEAIAGKMVYTQELKRIAREVSNFSVPFEWLLLSYPTMKGIVAYLMDLRERVTWMKKWIEEGIPKSFWLAAFFYPQSFLISCQQNYSRRNDIPLANIDYEYLIGELSASHGPSIHVYGLALEGARWDVDRKLMVEQKNKEITMKLPGLHLIPTDTKSKEREKERIFNCPVFKTESRRDHERVRNTFSYNFVTRIPLKTELDADVWIKRGVAIILQSAE